MLANQAELQINYVKEDGTYKDLTDADATEEFWKGMLLGLTESNHRNTKKKDDNFKKGLSASVLMQARGGVIDTLGE